jgi:hypothetical protein
MLFTDIIRATRDGGTLSDEQLQYFVAGLSDGSIPAEQVSALAMAIFLNSLTAGENRPRYGFHTTPTGRQSRPNRKTVKTQHRETPGAGPAHED